MDEGGNGWRCFIASDRTCQCEAVVDDAHILYKEVETYRSPEDLGSLVHAIEQYLNKVHIPASVTASLPEAMDIDTPEEESNSNAFAKQPEADIGRGLAGHGNAESPLFQAIL